MRDPDSTLANANNDLNETQTTAQPLALKRRSLLAYAASAPVATTTVGLLGTATRAEALPLPLTPPDSVDNYDIGDSLVQLGALTMPLVHLSVDAAGVYTMELPRLEQGTGIATAVAMMIAEEAGVPLSMEIGRAHV